MVPTLAFRKRRVDQVALGIYDPRVAMHHGRISAVQRVAALFQLVDIPNVILIAKGKELRSRLRLQCGFQTYFKTLIGR